MAKLLKIAHNGNSVPKKQELNSNQMKVSIYKNIKDTTSSQTINLSELVASIRQGNVVQLGQNIASLVQQIKSTQSKKERDKLKCSLPNVTVSGVFKKRSKQGLLNYSGLIQVDFDNLLLERLPKLREALENDPYTLTCFISPSGKGLKLIVKVLPNKERHLDSFLGLEKYYLDKYSLTLDTKCKDIGRTMYLSYDPEVFVNWDSQVFVPPLETTQKQVKETDPKPKKITASIPSNIESELLWLKNAVRYIETNKIDITKQYNDWLLVGFALANFLESNGQKYFIKISQFYPNYDQAESEKQFDHCLTQESIHKEKKYTIYSLFRLFARHNIPYQIAPIENSNLQNETLNSLLKHIKPIDFGLLANPEIKGIKEELATLPKGDEKILKLEKLLTSQKVTKQQFLILAIQQLLATAKNKNWGLCKKHDFIYAFNGQFWEKIEKDLFKQFLGTSVELMGISWDLAKYYKFRDDLLQQFYSEAYLPVPKTSKNKVLINLKNGTFEIGAMGRKLMDFNSADFITYQLPFEYAPKAKAPLFEKYLDEVLPEIEKQMILAEYLGFVFMKHGNSTFKEEKALILYGTGANGKSVFFEVIKALFGENMSNYSLQSLTDQNGYYRASLADKLVNYASEINGKMEAAIFKQLVSGEPVEARHPYGKPFILTQYAKLIFNCNELPKDVEHTHAFFRRFLIVPFEVTIPEAKQDKSLHSKIIEGELAGVFNWVLKGLERLLSQRKFTECEAVKNAVDQYKTQSDSVKSFIAENNYQKSPNQYILIKCLYQEYRIFCNDDGLRPVKKGNFKKRLENMGIVTQRKREGNVVFLEQSLIE